MIDQHSIIRIIERVQDKQSRNKEEMKEEEIRYSVKSESEKKRRERLYFFFYFVPQQECPGSGSSPPLLPLSFSRASSITWDTSSMFEEKNRAMSFPSLQHSHPLCEGAGRVVHLVCFLFTPFSDLFSHSRNVNFKGHYKHYSKAVYHFIDMIKKVCTSLQCHWHSTTLMTSPMLFVEASIMIYALPVAI